MTAFRAFRVEKRGRKFERHVVKRATAELPPGDVLIDVEYSSLNYKDALSAIGNPGVTRTYPHTPGIDAAGTVVESSSNLFAPGAAAIVCGYDLGMNTPGGFGQRIRVPVGWVLPMPEGLDARSAMILGTAGFTAALAVDRLEAAGMQPDDGPVLVTGATGGVGSVAVALLARLGYKVHAATGKVSSYQFLIDLGAANVIWRDELLQSPDRPLLKAEWGGAIDTVGGPILFNAVKALRYGASLAACGLVALAQVLRHRLPVHSARRQPAGHRFGRAAPGAQGRHLAQAGRPVEAGRARHPRLSPDPRQPLGRHRPHPRRRGGRPRPRRPARLTAARRRAARAKATVNARPASTSAGRAAGRATVEQRSR